MHTTRANVLASKEGHARLVQSLNHMTDNATLFDFGDFGSLEPKYVPITITKANIYIFFPFCNLFDGL